MNGRTQKEIAKEMNISPQWLSVTISKGDASMNLVNKIANVLNVDPINIVILEN